MASSKVNHITEAVHGSAYRVAPSVASRQAAFFWKFWVSGDEVYATNRSGGHLAKISVHKTGQIHLRLGAQECQILARPLLLGNDTWLHAIEIRFLLSPGASLPPKEDLKKKKGFLIEVPQGTVLLLNLIVGRSPGQNPADLPHELLPAAQVIWHAVLRGQQPVVLTARVLDMDDKNREAIRYIREELNPRANFSEEPMSPPYVEIRHVFWDPTGGNVLLVIPMGREGYRVQSTTAET